MKGGGTRSEKKVGNGGSGKSDGLPTIRKETKGPINYNKKGKKKKKLGGEESNIVLTARRCKKGSGKEMKDRDNPEGLPEKLG